MPISGNFDVNKKTKSLLNDKPKRHIRESEYFDQGIKY